MKNPSVVFLKTMAAAAFAMVWSLQGAPAPVQKDHVPATLDKVRTIDGRAAKRNHLLIVNVDGAIPEKVWPLVVNYAASRINVNIWTNTAPRSMVGTLVSDSSAIRKTFGDKASLVVFLENKPEGPAFVNVPGGWSMVNLRSVTRGNPDAQTINDRYAKMILKGIAFACGGGASLDGNCSLFYGSFSPEGMDGTGIRISPMSYFPMLETLRAIGGGDITNITYDEE